MLNKYIKNQISINYKNSDTNKYIKLLIINLFVFDKQTKNLYNNKSLMAFSQTQILTHIISTFVKLNDNYLNKKISNMRQRVIALIYQLTTARISYVRRPKAISIKNKR